MINSEFENIQKEFSVLGIDLWFGSVIKKLDLKQSQNLTIKELENELFYMIQLLKNKGFVSRE